jgi:hypothetical protein
MNGSKKKISLLKILLNVILFIFKLLFTNAAFIALIYNFLSLNKNTGKKGRVICEKIKKLKHDIFILK